MFYLSIVFLLITICIGCNDVKEYDIQQWIMELDSFEDDSIYEASLNLLESGSQSVPMLIDKARAGYDPRVSFLLERIGEPSVPYLIDCIIDNDEAAEDAIFILSGINPIPDEAISTLIEFVKSSSNLQLKVIASNSLIRMGYYSQDVTNTLIEGLLSDNKNICSLAGDGIISMGTNDRFIAPRLLQLLQHENKDIILESLSSLRHIDYKYHNIVDNLIDILQDTSDFEIKLSIIETLGKYGSLAYRAIPLLCDELKSENVSIVNSAIESIANIAPGNEKCLLATIEIARQGNDNTILCAIESLALYHNIIDCWPAIIQDSLEIDNYELRRVLFETIDVLSYKLNIHEVVSDQYLDSQMVDVRYYTSYMLYKSEAAGDDQTIIHDCLNKLLLCDDVIIRLKAASLLILLDPNMLDIYLGLMIQAISELCQNDDYYYDYYFEIRLWLLEQDVMDSIIGLLGSEKYNLSRVLNVIRLGLTSENETVMLFALECTSAIGKRAAELWPLLIELCDDQDIYNKIVIAKALGKIIDVNNKGESEFIIDEINNIIKKGILDYNDNNRGSAASAIGELKLDSKENIDGLIVLLDDGHPDVRELAAEAIGKIGLKAGSALNKLNLLMESKRPDDISNRLVYSAAIYQITKDKTLLDQQMKIALVSRDDYQIHRVLLIASRLDYYDDEIIDKLEKLSREAMGHTSLEIIKFLNEYKN